MRKRLQASSSDFMSYSTYRTPTAALVFERERIHFPFPLKMIRISFLESCIDPYSPIRLIPDNHQLANLLLIHLFNCHLHDSSTIHVSVTLVTVNVYYQGMCIFPEKIRVYTYTLDFSGYVYNPMSLSCHNKIRQFEDNLSLDLSF